MKKILLALFTIFISSTIFAYWGEITKPNAITKDNQVDVGIWCYGGCQFYNPNKSYKKGDILAIKRQDGSTNYIVVREDVGPNQVNPDSVPKSYSRARYNQNQLWFEWGDNNEYISSHFYDAGDVVYRDRNLHVFSGDYSKQNSRPNWCNIPKKHDPSQTGCWGKPNESAYNKVFFVRATSNLSDEEKRSYYSKHKVYNKEDIALISPNYYTETGGYISYANINKSNLKRCISLGNGVVNKNPLQSNLWSCQ